MLMMLAKGASIISIIEGPFLHVWPPMRPMTPHLLVVSQPHPKKGLGARFQNGPLMMQILKIFGDSQNASWGFAFGAHVILEWSWNGVREVR